MHTIPRIPAFTVKSKDGQNPDTLNHAFLKRVVIDLHNPPVLLVGNNGTKYQAVYDNVILKEEDVGYATICIVSFQSHSYGNFAIIRNLYERKGLRDVVERIVEGEAYVN